MDPNYPDDLIIANRFGPGDLVFSYDQVVEMGGWDIDFFNRIVVNDDDMRDVMLRFVYTSARIVYDDALDTLDEIEDDLYKSTFSVEAEVRDGQIENDRERMKSVEAVIESVLSTKSDAHANYMLEDMTADEILAVFVQGGCYNFDEPTVYMSLTSTSNRLDRYLPHLFRFQTNLFLSMFIEYIEDDSYRMLAPFKTDDFTMLLSTAQQMRKDGEEP